MYMDKALHYFKIRDDIDKYPDAWLYMAVGGRSTGKTYNALLDCYENDRRFLFVKRTQADVNLLCDSKRSDLMCPFKAINRDIGSDVKAQSAGEGIGVFIEDDHLIGYIGALTGIGKFTGFDLSDCDWIIFDEFIPRKWDRVFKAEGEQLLELYMTVNRDRELRGLPPTKVICLANAANITCPTNNALMLTDTFGDMIANNINIHYDEDKGIVIHILGDNDVSNALKRSKFYKAVQGTTFASMAFDNEFSSCDTSAIGTVSLKGYKCKCCVRYQLKDFYVYRKGRNYYVTLSSGVTDQYFDLDKEIDQRSFMINYQVELKYATIDEHCIFEKYSFYDMIMNYNRYFKV